MNRRLHLRLTPRLTLIYTLFAAALLTFVGILAYYSGRAGLEAATISALSSTSFEKASALDGWIGERQSDLAVIAMAPRIVQDTAALFNAGSDSAAARTAHDHLVLELSPSSSPAYGFLALFVLDPETGQVIAATDSATEGTFKEDRPYFSAGKNGPYVQNAYYSLQLQKPVIVVSTPLTAGDGSLLAVLAGYLNLKQLDSIIAQRTGLQQSDDAFLMSGANLFVTQPRLMPDPVVFQRGLHTVAINRCLAGNSGTVSADDYRDIPAIIVYRWLPDHEVCLIVKLDQAEAFASVQTFGAALLLIGGIALVAASLLGAGLARSITRPIQALQAGVTRFGRGELATRLPENSFDELGELAHEFNQMAVAIVAQENRLHDNAAQLEAANHELEAFSYSVSHDLRSPLRAIDGFSRMLLRDYEALLPAEGQRRLQVVRDNAQQMGELIDDLLTFSRLSRQPLKKEPVAPTSLVRRVLSDLSAEQDGRQVEITVADLPTCQADPGLLKQVFVNLLSNALKYTRKCQVAHIEVGFKSYDGAIVYFVKDNGAGFDMRYVDKLFGVFQRLHRAEDYEGTGVGLAMVQRIIHRHGGRIWAEAEVDRGATFYFTLEGKDRNDGI